MELLQVINQEIIDVVGYNAFDIGHVFTNSCTDVGGIAALSGVCNTARKGSGVSCHYSNDLDYIITNVTAHEMGHQFSAVHTFNYCDGENESDAGYEPGGGTSIMAYCGLCGGGNNLSATCLENFHAYSVSQIFGYSRNGGGVGCADIIETDNTAPIVNLKYKNGFYIPKSSYFVLEGSAEDCEDDVLTYSWEEMDLGPLTTPGYPQYDSPLYTALEPTTSATRYFPTLKSIIYQSFNNSEVVPDYARDLNFRLIARDNHPGAGGTGWADVSFKIDATSGPLTIESHGSGNIYYNNNPIEVNWDVANTDNDIVNCQYVDIYLTLDNGFTFPELIKYRTPNDGSETVYLPDTVSNLAKFMIKANDNIFFALEKYNFKIYNPIDTTFNISYDNLNGKYCIPDEIYTSLRTKTYNGYADSIRFELVGLPENTVFSISPEKIKAGESAQLNINFDNVMENGIFNPQLLAISNSGDTLSRSLDWEIVNNNFKYTEIYNPVPGSDKNIINPTFIWSKNINADTMDFYLSSDPSFPDDNTYTESKIVDTLLVPGTVLDYSTLYYWKIKYYTDCGEFDSDSIYTFMTATADCNNYVSYDVPITINDNNPCVSDLTIEDDLKILDLNVIIQGSHSGFRELSAYLTGPDETKCVLFNNKSTTYQGNISLVFDDQASEYLKTKPSGTFKPDSSLSVFNDKSTLGTWYLTILDNKDQVSGKLDNFTLNICTPLDPNQLNLVENNMINIPNNTYTPITQNYLKVVDDKNTASYLFKYTVIKTPENGELYLGTQQLNVGDQFAQSDIELGYLNIRSKAKSYEPDYFVFTINDGNGGWIDQTRFYYQVDETLEVSESNFQYQIFTYPNPVIDYLNVDIELDGEYNVELFDLNGRKVFSSQQQGFESKYINLNNLSSGIYILKIYNDKFIYTNKIVK
ncbi:MAG: M12 family metallo-peptidase [Saprospiraceae bacterium]